MDGPTKSSVSRPIRDPKEVENFFSGLFPIESCQCTIVNNLYRNTGPPRGVRTTTFYDLDWIFCFKDVERKSKIKSSEVSFRGRISNLLRSRESHRLHVSKGTVRKPCRQVSHLRSPTRHPDDLRRRLDREGLLNLAKTGTTDFHLQKGKGYVTTSGF